MKQKHKDLILHLQSAASPVNSGALAQAMGISPRTVKSYIAEINREAGEPVILSSREGYRLAGGELALDGQAPQYIPQTYSERARYLVAELLVQGRTPNLHDLCDQLYISYSTLKKVVARMNESFRAHGVHLTVKNDILRIEGGEQDMRRLLSYMVLEEADGTSLDLEELKRTYQPAFVEAVEEIIRRSFEAYEYYISQFSYTSLLLHFIILIDRVRAGHYLGPTASPALSYKEQALAQELAEELSSAFGLTLTDSERAEVAVLIKTHVDYATHESLESLREAVPAELLETVGAIVEKAGRAYSLELEGERFLLPFTLFIQGMLTRIENKVYTPNPLLGSIRGDFFLYDIAIFIALELEAVYGGRAGENEIALIALHVGMELERKRSGRHKVQCVLLCPGFHGIEERIYNQLMIDYGGELNIVAAVTSHAQLKDYRFDLLISTVDVKFVTDVPVVKITPFRIQEKHMELYSQLARLRERRQAALLAEHFDTLFDGALFGVGARERSRDELLADMCRDLFDRGLVSDTFYNHVCQREEASSTAFDAIALPHSVHFDAYQTRIFVHINRAGIPWGGQKPVHLVLLIAVSPVERDLFRDLYEALVRCLNDPDIIGDMAGVETFAQFRRIVLDHIAQDGGRFTHGN